MAAETSRSRTNFDSVVTFLSEANSHYSYSHLEANFDIVCFIKSGAFGEVFKVKHKIDDQLYAIKRIPLPDDEESRNRIQREPKIWAQCVHPNIVRYHASWIGEESVQSGDDTSTDSIVSFRSDTDQILQQNVEKKLEINSSASSKEEMSEEEITSTTSKMKLKSFLNIQLELCDTDLAQWLYDNNQCFDVKERISKFMGIVNAVDYLHSKNLFHRDLKPSNILIGLDGKVKIGDFGTVKLLVRPCNGQNDEGTSSDTENIPNTKSIGTLLYTAPKQEDGTEYDEKVDIYSLGMVFFVLLSNFKTEMERRETLTSLRAGIFQLEFFKKHPFEYVLIKEMLSIEPIQRPCCADILQMGTLTTRKTYSSQLYCHIVDRMKNQLDYLVESYICLFGNYEHGHRQYLEIYMKSLILHDFCDIFVANFV